MSREVMSLTPSRLRSWPLPTPGGDKGSRGTVLVIGGSRVTPGAVLLAGMAGLRAGAGKLQIATTESTSVALGVAVPESMVMGLPETSLGALAGRVEEELAALVAQADVVLMGPGLVDVDETKALVDGVLACVSADTQLVLDAYALAAVAGRPELVRGRAKIPVLTPNLDEGALLLGRDLTDDIDREAALIAEEYNCVTSLFGHIAAPEEGAWRDETDSSGLGTSGSGDVAAGLVAGLLARGATSAQAACWGIHVHAAAGQRLAVEHGRASYLAREIVDEIAPALAALEV